MRSFMVRELGSTERHKGYYAQLRSSGGTMGFLCLRDLGSKERHKGYYAQLRSSGGGTVLSHLHELGNTEHYNATLQYIIFINLSLHLSGFL